MKSKFFLGLFSGIFLFLVISLFVAPYLGIFNMSATGKPGILDWWGDTNFESSLRWYAPEASIPDDIDLQNGQHHYKEMCLQCHGAPGVASLDWPNRMMPAPPKVWKTTKEMEDGEIFWVIKHGIKMTGMPSFGSVHDEQEIWSMVAFIRRMDSLTPKVQQDFQAYVKKLSGHKHGKKRKSPEKGKDPNHTH